MHTARISRSLNLTARKQTVAHASGSERYVFLPWLLLLVVLPSVFFRVIPWQMLLLILGLISVANASAYSYASASASVANLRLAFLQTF